MTIIQNKYTLPLLLATCCCGYLASTASAWVISPSSLSSMTRQSVCQPKGTPSRSSTTQLFYIDDANNNNDNNNNDFVLPSSATKRPTRIRASLDGVSLAPQGFWVMLRIADDAYIPWQVTDDPQDATAATSAESLTMIQLLSGVDMAGAILPPDVLARMVVLQCERLVFDDNNNKDNQQQQQHELARNILSHVQDSLPNATASYSQVHPWVQSRVKLPEASLDEVLVTTSSTTDDDKVFSLTCQIRNFGSLTFTPTQQMLESVLYQYSPATSLAFTSLALALRYKAPITMVVDPVSPSNQKPDTNDNNNHSHRHKVVLTMQDVQESFPMYKPRTSLQQSSHRVQENIVRGFEIHKLTGALRIAMERGDVQAAAKIRQALDKYDSMEELPTVPMSEGASTNHNGGGGIIIDNTVNGGGGNMDDDFNNVLQ